ncbi:hypothetical protein GCM10010172_79340 [Paractinoplanes ferrugineus]|uniref:FAD-binding domain-containing protein n=1 Tax=Paractinoplanes ferrugineus TaxID=113564 RepID=A0A919MEQ2_9ACTN|nr:hypothetical protein Afe05nite_48480 [Actinoplanes ferrugineus]
MGAEFSGRKPGAGIAGPALAYWLHRYGFTVTVVEKAPEVRAGGQVMRRGETAVNDTLSSPTRVCTW